MYLNQVQLGSGQKPEWFPRPKPGQDYWRASMRVALGGIHRYYA